MQVVPLDDLSIDMIAFSSQIRYGLGHFIIIIDGLNAMNIKAIYPGTFDPITYGHLDIIKRANNLFSHLCIAITDNTTKSPWLDTKTRYALMCSSTQTLPNVSVCTFDGLLVELAHNTQASVLVRGVRGSQDLDYELNMAWANRTLAPTLETVFLAPSPGTQAISSSLVRDIARFDGDLTPFVPQNVADVLITSLKDKKQGGRNGT